MKKKNSIIYGTFLLLLLVMVSIPRRFSFAAGEETASLSAVLYDTDAYSEGTGTELTDSGATVTGWQYDTSKYLQINPAVPHDGNIYSVTIKLPQELYAVTTGVSAPTGFSDATFTKNPIITADDYNGSNNEYNLNNFSGTFKYTLEAGITSSTLQMEVRYDRTLWDKKSNSLLTAPTVKPIEVILTNETTGTTEKTIYISEARSNGAFPIGNLYNHTYLNGKTYYDSVNLLAANTAQYYHTIVTSSQVTETLYYDTLQYVIRLPNYTEGGVTYYPEIVKSGETLQPSDFKYSNFTPELDTSELSTGKITLTYHNVYMTTSNSPYRFSFKFPEELLRTSSANTWAFSGGKQEMWISQKDKTMVELTPSRSMPSLIYSRNATENVTLGYINKSVTNINRPTEAVSVLGGFSLRNAGAGDSEPKTFKITFDSTNTGYMRVTTYRIHLDSATEIIPIKYTLMDDNGDKVCINSVCEWTYNLSNSEYGKTGNNKGKYFYRTDLPTEQRGYYFKTLEYTLTALPKETYMYSSGGSANYDSAGNFTGFIVDEAPSGTQIKTTMAMSSENYATINRTSTTTVTTTHSVAYGVSSATVDKKNIIAGESVNVSGIITTADYPYGINGWLDHILVGMILPEGVTINEQSIYAYTNNSNNKFYPESVTATTAANGKIIWKIVFDRAALIGRSSESIGYLSVGNKFRFFMQLDTSMTMNQQTINMVDSLYVGSSIHNQAASGSWAWATKKDKYDLNNNNSTTDNVGGLRTTTTGVSFEVTPQKATFEISDKIEVTTGGSIGVEGQTADIETTDDTISYKLKLDCNNGGFVENFSYYIPVPTKTYTPDTYLITSTENAFDMQLLNSASVSGNDLYNIYYTNKPGINYDNKDDEGINWYTADELASNGINYSDVTMIKLLSKVSMIENGSTTTIIIPFKYKGTNYKSEAGKNYTFQSAGYFSYSINGRFSSGNFSTDGVTANLTYEKDLNDFSFVVSKDGSIAKQTFVITEIPAFEKDQTYKITNVEVNGVTLRTRDYINTNSNMEPVLANTNFAVTLKLNDGTEQEILSSANTTPINLGSVTANGKTNFTFKIYSANTIGSLYLDTREVIVTLTSNNGVTIKQKMSINTPPASAAEPELGIQAGKSYTPFDDATSSINISKDSAFTSQFVVNYVPDNYATKEFKFSSELPVGTTLTLIDKVDGANPDYYYNNVTSAANTVALTDFIKMGTTNHYTYLTGAIEKKEIILLVIDFSKCSTYLSVNTYNLYLKFNSSIVDPFESNSLTFNIKDKRAFNIISNSEVNMDQNLTVTYNSTASQGTESNYIGRKTALVLKAPNNIPLDTHVQVNSTKYYMNKDREFIIPLSNVQTTSESITLRMNSSMLPKTPTNYEFNASVWVSVTANASSPKAGEKISDFTITFKSVGEKNPSIKVVSMAKRLIKNDSISAENTLTYDFIDDPTLISTIELQQKIGSSYQKVTNMLSKVNGTTVSDMGVFTITSVNGSNQVNFNLSSSMPNGTYRMMIRVKDQTGKELINVPYNFIILEK